MQQLPHRLTDEADRDITRILEETRIDYGSRQVVVYAALIDLAIEMITEQPDRPSSKRRPELDENLRSFRVAHAAHRRGAASHVLFYTVMPMLDDGCEVVVLRVLHDSMEPRLATGLDPIPLLDAPPPQADPDDVENPFSP